MSEDKFVGAGGTPGGIGQFLAGILCAGIGVYLMLNQVQVTTSWGHFWGFNSFGLSLVPMLIGIGMLFFNGRSVVGWILTILGFGIILAGILMNMDIYFKPTSLYNTLFMLALLAAGLGLIARSLRAAKVVDPREPQSRSQGETNR
jgi:uncharacterized protein